MKIIYISNSVIPSLEANGVHVMKMCQAFADEGHETLLCARRPRKDAARESGFPDLARHYGISLDFALKRMRTLRGFRGRDYVFRSAWAAKRKKYDLCYTRSLAAANLSCRLGVPTVFEAHSPVMNARDASFFERCLRSPAFRKLVVISRSLGTMFQDAFEKRLSAERVIVAPDGVDLERFGGALSTREAREKLGMEPGGFQAGYAGHLYPGRGIEIVLDAAVRLPGVRFLVLGGNPEDVRRFRDKAASMGLENVRFHGFVANKDLPLYLWACDALLMPYRKNVYLRGGRNTASWMSPMKMFEYLAAGRVILSSDLPVLREVLGSENAVLCDPEDKGSWIEALRRVREEPERFRALAHKAREDAARYSWRARAKRILKEVFADEREGKRAIVLRGALFR